MKILPTHPSLTQMAIETTAQDWRKSVLFVAPKLFRIANEIAASIMKGFLDNNPDLKEKFEEVELYRRYGITVQVVDKMNDNEWLLIADADMYYSNGTNSA